MILLLLLFSYLIDIINPSPVSDTLFSNVTISASEA